MSDAPTILIVDHSEVDRRTTRLVLRELERQMIAVGDLPSARKELARGDVQVLVVDQQFPEDELTEFIADAYRDSPGLMVALTGHDGHALSHQHDLYVRKPFDVEYFLSGLRRLLERQQREASG